MYRVSLYVLSSLLYIYRIYYSIQTLLLKLKCLNASLACFQNRLGDDDHPHQEGQGDAHHPKCDHRQLNQNPQRALQIHESHKIT